MNTPPLAIANLPARMFGKEFSWPLINKAPSVNPAVNDPPTAIYFEKSKFVTCKATFSASSGSLISGNSLFTSQEFSKTPKLKTQPIWFSHC